MSHSHILSSMYRVYEVQVVTRGSQSNGSFLVEPDMLIHRTDLRIQTEVDPFFILLEPFIQAASAEGPFIDYIDAMNGIIERSAVAETAREGATRLVQCLNQSANFKQLFIDNFCDARTVIDRDLVRVNKGKIITWLKSKLALVEEYLISTNVYLVETCGQPDQLSKILALELIRSYVSESVYLELVADIGYSTDSLFADTPVQSQDGENKLPSNGDSKKRPAPVTNHPTAKKLKEISVAKSCMKMTSFFKPKS